MVRELGLERRETVWSLSTVSSKKNNSLTLVREDREEKANCNTIMGLIPVSCNATLCCVT